MKIIAEIISKENFLRFDLDGYIFSYLSFYTMANQPMTITELDDAVKLCHNHHKLAILKLDQWIEEKQLDLLHDFLTEIESVPFDYILFSDFSILHFYEQRACLHKLIYTAKTLNCSLEDVSYWNDKQIKVVLSHEISLQDIEKITVLSNVVMDGYGYSTIFYSKRKLLSLFGKKYQANRHFNNQFFTIQEENKREAYPIIQNENGTFILSKERYGFIKELLTVSDFYFYKIDTVKMNESELTEIIQTIRFIVQHRQLPQLLPPHASPFLYQKNLVLKEDTE